MPSRSPASRDLALIATFAALLAALGLTPAVAVPGIPVPITLQMFGVLIAGLVLGATRGAAAVLVYLALVAAGLPLLPGGRGGLAPFVGPTAGYLVGFPVAAFVTGAVVRLRRRPGFGWALFAALGGIVVEYAFGIPVQAAVVGTRTVGQTLTASAVFLPGDLVKAVLASAVATAVYRGYPQTVDAEARPTPPPSRTGGR